MAKLEKRLRSHAQAKWPGCRAVVVRTRGAFVYVDAQGREDEQPEPLFRLRYMGDAENWEFAFFTWSRETYEPSVLDSGLPFGTPEECFDAAAFPMFGAS
jgi:hypothetical protein